MPIRSLLEETCFNSVHKAFDGAWAKLKGDGADPDMASLVRTALAKRILEMAQRVVWTPSHGVRVELHGTTRTEGDRWMRAYDTQDPTRETDRLLGMFILFNTLVVRDRIDPKAVHAAFLEIDEYRMSISPESPGAD